MPKGERFGTWPFYSSACRRDMDALLQKGGGLSAYRSNPKWPLGPVEGSWAWRLERLIEKQFDIAHAIVCSSGTMALMAGLRALNLKPGEIVTSPYTFSATAAAIRYMGHEPVFADIDPATFCLDPVSAATVVNSRTRAILPVDLFGQLADYDGLWKLGLPILSDSCQAVGALGKAATYRQAPFRGGRGGVIGVYSFNGGKQVPAGEAGAVVTQDAKYAERARGFISHMENWANAEIGINGRLNEPTALIAYHGMKDVLKRNAQRQKLAARLVERLRFETRIRTLPEPAGHALYVFPMVLAKGLDRVKFANMLRAKKIEVGEGYLTPPIHRYEAFKFCRTAPTPVVDELSEKSLVILSQVRPPATLSDMDWLADAIRVALDHGQVG